jgi:hypothetical protein
MFANLGNVFNGLNSSMIFPPPFFSPAPGSINTGTYMPVDEMPTIDRKPLPAPSKPNLPTMDIKPIPPNDLFKPNPNLNNGGNGSVNNGVAPGTRVGVFVPPSQSATQPAPPPSIVTPLGEHSSNQLVLISGAIGLGAAVLGGFMDYSTSTNLALGAAAGGGYYLMYRSA